MRSSCCGTTATRWRTRSRGWCRRPGSAIAICRPTSAPSTSSSRCVSEPWDGPSALVFADGRYVGAALDRNGFRPARIVSTADDLIAVASEVGVLPADEHEIVNRGRLGPGDMIVVDVERGSVMGTNEIRRRLAFRRRYRRLVADVVRPLADPVGVDVGDADRWRADCVGPPSGGPGSG